MPETPGLELEKILAELDFVAAQALVDRASPEVRKDLQQQVDHAKAEAKQQAEHLAGRIQSLARADHYEGLLAVATHPLTDRLLSLLPPELHRGARVHLDGAQRRQVRFQQSAERHMEAAQKHLVQFETAKARAELEKVEGRWLNQAQRQQLEEMKRQVKEATAEHRELAGRTSEILRDHHPVYQAPDKKPRFRRGGCFGSLLGGLILAAVLLVLVVA